MKQIFLIAAFGLLFMSSKTKANVIVNDTSAYQFFIQYEIGTPLDTLMAYLTDLNSIKIWGADDLNLELWQVQGYPFVTSSGQTINNIYEVIRTSKAKTKISDATFNTSLAIENLVPGPPTTCFDPTDFSIVQGSNTVKISILDTGISDISDNTTSNYNYNFSYVSGYDYVENDAIPDDDQGHGSHIAGIINSIVKDISPAGTSVVFDIRKTHDANGQAMMSNVVIALHDAIESGANIVNMSFGVPDTFNVGRFFPLRLIIQSGQEDGVLIIAAGGNEGINNDNYLNTVIPSSFPDVNVMAVGAVECDGDLTSFTNFGRATVDVTALGIDIPGPDLSNGIKYASGTSQSTAIATGVAALLGTYQSTFDGELTKCALTNGSAKLPQLSNFITSRGKISTATGLSMQSNVQASYMVTDTIDHVPGSLRHAIENICGVEQIFFANSTADRTILISDRELRIDSEVALIGSDINSTKIKSDGNFSAILVANSAELSLETMQIIRNALAMTTIISYGRVFFADVLIK